jgi:type I restriction enzyme S subunit
MSWGKLSLGALCTITKGTTGIQKAVPGEFPMVVTGEERKSHNEYQFDDEAVIVPLVSGTGHGHASIKRIHYQTGKFALGSILCAIIPKDKTVLNTEYLFRFLDLNRENELVARMKGMANVSLPIKEIAKIEIPVPDLNEQIRFVEQYKILEQNSWEINAELNHQLDLVKQLRQSFLREAMQGKLTSRQAGDEETQETGRELLDKIKAEKALLIKDKKLKKEKELPPVKPEEIPFEIPEDWVWCRLGEVALYSEAGKSFKCVEVPINEGEWGVIKVSAVSWDSFLENQNKLYSKTEPNDTSARIENGDFLISRANTSELVGKSVVVKNITKNLLLSDKTIRFRFSTNVSSDFLNFCNNLKYARDYYAKMGTGSSPSMKNITRVHMNNLVIPLPPHFKQNLILNRIEHIQLICGQLEASIKQSQQQNEQLLQQVLREALEVEEVGVGG